MKEIQLTRNMIAVVDDKNFEELNKFRWQAVPGANKLWYARTTLKLVDGSTFICMMHWAVLKLKPPKGVVIDHINGNGVWNTEENLRVVYCRQNTQNKHKKYTSKYPGVSLIKSTKKWLAHIKIGNKIKHLGTFKTEEEAFEKYKWAVAVCGQTVLYKKEIE